MTPERLEAALQAVAEGGLRAREEAAAELLGTPVNELVRFLVARIPAPAFRLRNAALELLGRLGPAGLAALTQQLPELDDEARMFLAPVLGDMQDARALAILHEWLGADDVNLVAMTCEAVGRYRNPASVPVLAALVERDPWMAGPAIAAIGRIGDPAGREPLLAALGDEEHRLFAVGALGQLADVGAWPALAAALDDDPGLIPVALPDLDPLLAKLSAPELRGAIADPAPWAAAAAQALTPEAWTPAAVRLLGALAEPGVAVRLIDLYLEHDEHEAILEALRQLPDAAHALRVRLDDALGDEATRRAVRLIGELLSESATTMLGLLAHPSGSVRLEIVVAMERRGFEPEILAALLGDPDALVRGMAMQVLRRHWDDHDTAVRIAEELDPDALAADVLEALAVEGPPALADAVAEAAGRRIGSGAGTAARRLRRSLDARRDPDALLADLAAADAPADEIIELLPLAAGIEGRRAVDLLLRLARHRDPALAYAAGEALCRHADVSAADLAPLLSPAPPAELLTVLAAWAASSPDGGALLSHLPLDAGAHAVEVEVELLRAWRRHAPTAARARFTAALSSPEWRVQLEGLRGLEAAGMADARRQWLDHLDPLAREVLDAEGAHA
jgi:hypothetical protein